MSPLPVGYLGYDPGADSALALLVDHGGPRPVLVETWEIHGPPHLWYARLDGALVEVLDLQARLGLHQLTAWAEDWTSARAEARSRQVAWVALGRAQGAFLGLACHHLGQVPTLVPPGAEDIARRGDRARLGWADLLGVRRGKDPADGGQHRISEAILHVGGDVRERLARVASKKRRVDLAEAILIAAAAFHASRREQLESRLASASGRRR